MSENYSKQSQSELEKQLAEKRKALRDFRFGATGSRNSNVKAVSALRKEVARIMTALGTK